MAELKWYRKTWVILFILTSLALIICSICLIIRSAGLKILGGGLKPKRVGSVRVKEALRVGEVRWRVLKVEKKKQIEQRFLEPVRAPEVFIILELEAEKLGGESGVISSDQLKIVDSKERMFNPSDEGRKALLLLDKKVLSFEELQPDTPFTGYVVFDVAKDSTQLKLEIVNKNTFNEYGYIDLGL